MKQVRDHTYTKKVFNVDFSCFFEAEAIKDEEKKKLAKNTHQHLKMKQPTCKKTNLGKATNTYNTDSYSQDDETTKMQKRQIYITPQSQTMPTINHK